MKFKKKTWTFLILNRTIFFQFTEAHKNVIMNAAYQAMEREAQATTQRINKLQNEFAKLTKATVQMDKKSNKK